MNQKKCKSCDSIYIKKPSESLSYWKSKRFCSNKCKEGTGRPKTGINKKCRNCGYQFYVKKCHLNYLKCCSKQCMGKWNSKNRIGIYSPNWKGGILFKNGYILVFKPEHPNHNSLGYVYLHRIIMEEKINRFLTKKEVVHHIDGNPGNNNPENLMLFANNGEHRKFHGITKEI